MITQWIWEFIQTFLTGLLGLFPSWSLPANMGGSLYSLGQSAGNLSGYFPVTTLALVVALLLSYRLFSLGFRAVVFVYQLIPFKMT